MAIALVNHTSVLDTTGSFLTSKAAPAISATTGNCIAVFTRNEQNNVSSVTDTAGNTYAAATQFLRNAHVQWYFAKNITGNASNVVTANITGGGGTSQYIALAVFEFSGCDTAATFDVNVGTSGFHTSPETSPSFTTAQGAEVVLVGCSTGGISAVFTAGSGYTLSETQSNAAASIGTEYQIFSSVQTTVTASMSWTGGFNDTQLAVMSIKGAAAGTTFKSRKTLHGLGTRVGSRQAA
jgi:hypothetical protein